jgi:hypothetical protein
LAEAGGLRATWLVIFHIVLTIIQVMTKTQASSECENRTWFVHCNSLHQKPYFKG